MNTIRLLLLLLLGLVSACSLGGNMTPEYQCIHNDYNIYLEDGHTLKEHFQAIGKFIPQAKNFGFGLTGYSAVITDELLSLVRTDPKVKAIIQYREKGYPYMPRYIVRVKDGHTLEEHFQLIDQNLSDISTYAPYIPAYHGFIPKEIVPLVKSDPNVEYICQDEWIESRLPDDGFDLMDENINFQEGDEPLDVKYETASTDEFTNSLHNQRPERARFCESHDNYTTISDEYIVRFRDDYTLERHIRYVRQDLVVIHDLSSIINGYCGRIPGQVLSIIESDPNVISINPNREGRINSVTYEDKMPSDDTQRTLDEEFRNAHAYGLPYISQDHKYPARTYYYPSTAGANVDIYLLDTGVEEMQPDFDGRVSTDKSFLTNERRPGSGYDYDVKGHGTHVAGVVGGSRYGVAKHCNIISEMIINERGETDTARFIAGLQAVLDRHNVRKTSSPFRGTVIVTSARLLNSSDIAAAISKIHSSGITLVVDAGGSGDDVIEAKRAPAMYDEVITVASSDEQYRMDRCSGHGQAVDIIAPGDRIDTDSLNGDYDTVSSPSMAAAHVAGIIALFIGQRKTTSPDEAKHFLIRNADEDIISGVPEDTANLFSNSGYMKNCQHGPFVRLQEVDAIHSREQRLARGAFVDAIVAQKMN